MQQPTANYWLEVAAVMALSELPLLLGAAPAGNCSALYVLTRLNQQRFEVSSVIGSIPPAARCSNTQTAAAAAAWGPLCFGV
jgi:hypothetical protein